MDYRYSAQEPKYSQNYNAQDQSYGQPATQPAVYSQNTGYTGSNTAAFGQNEYGYQDPNGYDAYQDPNNVQESSEPSLSDYNSHES